MVHCKLMMVIAVPAQYLAPTRDPRLLLVALVSSEADPDALPFDPPLTPGLARDAKAGAA